MEQKNQMSRGDPSLLMLNDDCFYPIFKFLQFEDFVNLAETCSRLLFVGQTCRKFKNIEVTNYDRRYDDVPLYTVQELSNNLSVIGEHAASVRVYQGNDDILKTIADACTNLRSVEVQESSIAALPFCNLEELKVEYGVYLSTDEWKNFFANNPGIVCLEYCHDGRNKCLPLLQMLPELKSLTVKCLELQPEEFHHLSCLTSLTRFSFWSPKICCNQLLIELAVKLNLVELKVVIPCDTDTFAALKSFRCLEFLSIKNWHGDCDRIPETAIFPSTLKKIQLEDIDISCSVFVSLVKQLKLLKEFDIGYNGQIFWQNDENEYFPKRGGVFEDIQGSRIISRISNALRAEKRNLKIIFYKSFSQAHQVWKYSDNLEIIQRPWRDERTFDHTFRLQ